MTKKTLIIDGRMKLLDSDARRSRGNFPACKIEMNQVIQFLDEYKMGEMGHAVSDWGSSPDMQEPPRLA